MHVAGTSYPATAGCVAMQRAHLLRLLATAHRGSVLLVAGGRSKKRPE
jgi:L,D-peptidoglycan transpeptidase YkuD (ErfK/YbiS/YcfS/YnhG family)